MEARGASADTIFRDERAVPVVKEERRTVPVKAWAGLGALILAFEAFVIVKWVTGPYFTTVHVGPSDVPTWMEIALRSMEIGFFVLWFWCLWRFVITPYRRDGQLSTEGLLCLALFAFAWFQDPLANYGGAVFTYNADLINVGSWLNEVPGAVTPGAAGAQLPEPLWTASIYPGVIFVATLMAVWFMRKVKARFPRITNLELIGVTFVFMFLFDVILEGFVLMPLGAYTYAGAPDWISINDSHYYKYTLVEGMGFGAVWTCWAALLYFKDDKGNTLVERGIERTKASAPQKAVLRFLAIGAFVTVTMIACVNIPFFWQASHMSTYPADVQKRSYLTDGMCGEGTHLACFGQSVPIPQGEKSARVAPDGSLYVPPGTELPKQVPIDRGPLGSAGD
jgi:hypothetical protein